MQTLYPESGLRTAPNLQKNPKKDNDVKVFWHDVNVNLFWRCSVSLVKFSYWSNFHINIITGSGIFFYKGLTRNPEIGNTPVWVLPNIWRLGQVMNAKLATNVSNRMLLNAAVFELLRENQMGGVKLPPPRPD